MSAVAYHERRKQDLEIGFDDRRIRDRRNGGLKISTNRRRLSTQARQVERKDIALPAQIVIEGREVIGHTKDMSTQGLMVLSEAAISIGSPLSLRFSFSDICYLNVSGQVVSCSPLGNGSGEKCRIGIKLSGLRNFEQKVLGSALKELQTVKVPDSKSFLSLTVSRDTVALEAARLVSPVSVNKLAPGKTKGRNKFTPNPPWVLEMDEYLAPFRQAILESGIVYGTYTGELSLQQVLGWNIQFYPFIESFPRFMSLNLAKATDPVTRAILIDNIRVEKKHADQWIDMANGFGISKEELLSTPIIPEVEALTHWLWSINSRGSMAEGVAATNYSIEGITQGIAKLMVKGFEKYHGRDGVFLDKKAYWWMEAHAKYDDLHPLEAMEIIKRHTADVEMQEKVKQAAKRSLEYLLRALETCYKAYEPKTKPNNNQL